MATFFQDVYSVWWADLRLLRHLWLRFLITSLVSPLLYLAAFGYGLGRNIEVEGAPYLNFVIPGIIALTAMNTSFNYAGNKLNVDRLFYKSFDELLMAPITGLSLILGKSMIGILRGFVVALLFLLIGAVVTQAQAGPLFLFTLLLTCLTFSFLGIAAALMAKSHQDMATFSSLILLPMTFLGGTFFSVDQLPELMRLFVYIIPVTHASQCLRASFLGNPFPWLSLLVLGGYALVFFAACMQLLRRASV
ncbi:MAG: ABC transporter permease [Thermoleophilia bacterium]|nr:ABC transporter permease [Thermoleophilia bacterium]